MTDTEGARNDLRIAYKFLRDFEKNEFGDLELDSAMRYLRLARDKDPTVTWKHKDEKNKLVTTTPDVLEAIVLHHMAAPETLKEKENQSLERLHAAIGLLERSIALHPISMTYNRLFRAYCQTYQRDKALAIITEANRRYPEDHVIRSNLDYIKGNATLGTKTEARKPVNVFAVSLFVGFASLAIAILDAYYYLSYPAPPPNSAFEFFLVVGKFTWFVAIISFVAAYLNRPQSIKDYYAQLD
jgi:tetratricopeptide (TPR) repeat protein